MSGGLEAIERLINEADQKFLDKFRQCRAGASPNLAVLADRTFNLRQQVAHDAVLMGDAHFVTMLEDVETCLAPEYTLKGDLDRKLDAFLAGLLKGLLREAVSVHEFAPRKVQIEMTWHWFQDKKQQTLSIALDRMRPPTAPHEVEAKEDTKSETEPATALDVKPVERPSKAATAAQQKLATVSRSANSRCASTARGHSSTHLGFADEATRNTEHAAIAKQLALYRKPNLSKSEQLRERVRAATAEGAKRGDAVRDVLTKAARERLQRGDSGVRDPNAVRLRGTGGAGAESASGASGPPPFRHVQHAVAPRFNPPSSLARPPTTEETLATAHQRIVGHLAARVEQDQDAREMSDARHVLAFQQARLEEESARRLESEDLGGQAGRTCHTLLRRIPRQQGEPPVTAKSQLPSAKLPPEEVQERLGRHVSREAETSLSAHDHAVPTPLDEQRIKDMLERLTSKDDAVERQRNRLGLKSPHPNSMAGTGLQPGRLDLGTANAVATPIAPRGDVPLQELLFPALSREENVPSASRLEQLRLVERVRDCFARATTKGGDPIHVPRSTIERALLTPDDRPYEECIRLLPRAGGDFPTNPNPEKKEKGGKKGKGKGKK